MPYNVFQQGMDAFGRGYDATQAIQDQRTRVQAGRSLASGDRAGAAARFANAGMIPESRQMTGDQMAIDKQRYDQERQAQDDKLAAAERNLKVFHMAADYLGGFPQGQRQPHVRELSDLFDRLNVNIPNLDLNRLTENDLSDQSLAMFKSETDKAYQQVFQSRNGGIYGVDPKGDLHTLREPDPVQEKPPGMFVQDPEGNWIVNPVYVQGRAAVSSAMRAPKTGGAAKKPGAFVPQPTGRSF